MTFEDLREIAHALGSWQIALMIGVLVVLHKTGIINIVVRDQRKDEIEELRGRIVHVETKIEVLLDRWNRKD
jgi:hypothetical protein